MVEFCFAIKFVRLASYSPVSQMAAQQSSPDESEPTTIYADQATAHALSPETESDTLNRRATRAITLQPLALQPRTQLPSISLPDILDKPALAQRSQILSSPADVEPSPAIASEFNPLASPPVAARSQTSGRLAVWCMSCSLASRTTTFRS